MMLRELRKQKKLTQAECAKYLGVPLRTYQNYETDAAKRTSIKYLYMLEKLEQYGFVICCKMQKNPPFFVAAGPAFFYNRSITTSREAPPVAKHLDKFSRPFQNSPIPFVLAEALTNGTGDIVDLVCRFLNPAAAALLQLAPEEVQDRRLSQFAPAAPTLTTRMR